MNRVTARIPSTTCPCALIGFIIGSLGPGDDRFMFGGPKGLIDKLNYEVLDNSISLEIETVAGATFSGEVIVDDERNLSIEITPIKPISQEHFNCLMRDIRRTVEKQVKQSWQFHQERIAEAEKPTQPFPFNPVPC